MHVRVLLHPNDCITDGTVVMNGVGMRGVSCQGNGRMEKWKRWGMGMGEGSGGGMRIMVY